MDPKQNAHTREASVKAASQPGPAQGGGLPLKMSFGERTVADRLLQLGPVFSWALSLSVRPRVKTLLSE